MALVTSRSDVDALKAATQQVVKLAQKDLTTLFARFEGVAPELVRDALLEAMPALVERYGASAASVAADWYERVRAEQVVGRYAAALGDGAAEAAVTGSVRSAARHLFDGVPEQTLKVLSLALQRHVMHSARSTVAKNVATDPANPRYARVPTGATTCAFCIFMASRGFVYQSEKSAGATGGAYHDGCDCQLVPEWNKGVKSSISGYDPDRYKALYEEAADEAGRGGARAITYHMRRLHPELYADGVIDPTYTP